METNLDNNADEDDEVDLRGLFEGSSEPQLNPTELRDAASADNTTQLMDLKMEGEKAASSTVDAAENSTDVNTQTVGSQTTYCQPVRSCGTNLLVCAPIVYI